MNMLWKGYVFVIYLILSKVNVMVNHIYFNYQ